MSRLRRMYRNETSVPFSKIWTKVLLVSTVLLVVSAIGLFGRNLNLGLEFEGGGAWEVPVSNDLQADEVRDALRPLGLADARIQTGGGVLRVRTELTKAVQNQIDDAQEVDTVESITLVLAELANPDNPDPNSVSVSTAGPSWGDEITDKAVTALIVFFIIIALYITVRLRWEMAVGALIAVAHDIVITVGIYALFQLEVTPADASTPSTLQSNEYPAAAAVVITVRHIVSPIAISVLIPAPDIIFGLDVVLSVVVK